jgi:2-C-methyl-D-erythritol 4-phosphate cytidylyltransferase
MEARRVGVIIAAGGRGRRMGQRTPKQFLPLGGEPLIARTIRAYETVPAVDEIAIVVPAAFVGRVEKLVRRFRFVKVMAVVPGGKERQDSVWNGLRAFRRRPAMVLVHDAVRPFIDRETIEHAIAAVHRHRAAVVGVRVKDTIKVEGPRGFSTETLDREKLWAAQTPQGFDFRLLLRAHEKAKVDRFLATDETALVERLGVRVRIVEGNERNMKITTPADLRIAESLLKDRTSRR